MPATIVEVALPFPGRRTFTYRIPPGLAGRALPGSRVVVPFGRSPKVGFIVAVPVEGSPPPASDAANGRLLDVIQLPDEVPLMTTELLDLTRWAADYYLCSWGEAIRAALPGGSVLRPARRVRITSEGLREAESLLPEAAGIRDLLLQALSRTGEKGLARESVIAIGRRAISPSGTRRPAGTSEAPAASARRGGRRLVGPASAALARLVAQGLAEIIERAPRPRPMGPPGPSIERDGQAHAASPGDGAGGGIGPPRLMEAQQEALQAIVPALRESSPSPFLLEGVTGSGKTEVYLGAIDACLKAGKDALYLVPEIGLTPLLARQIRARFGECVAVLHSGLAVGERRSEWQRILRGEARVVLGPRSAVFAPLRRLGLVVIDEEQDPSYKQEEAPRYNGRDLALVRAHLAGVVAVLGTATPSLEAWRNARSGKYRTLALPTRIGGRPLPRIEVVDLREEFRETGEIRVLSRRLVEALRDRLARREQSVVLINRRGYAPFLLCRACGKTVGCSRCSVSLVLHRSDNTLRCHYCGTKRRPPVLCPICFSEHLQAVGEGTERVERHIQRELPEARVARMDSDTVRGRRAHEQILSSFERGDYDVIVGTQMVAKGHDFPAVTLVGVLLADAALGLPDFRAAERTYQLLTQVSGRAGRGAGLGEVIIQTVRPEHYAIATAAAHDEKGFYEKELRARRALRYPPFQVLAQVLSRASKPDKASLIARRAAEALRRHGGGRVQVLGPAPAPIARLKGRYRVQLIARAVSRRRLGAALRGMLSEAESEGYHRDLVIDVDPVTLM